MGMVSLIIRNDFRNCNYCNILLKPFTILVNDCTLMQSISVQSVTNLITRVLFTQFSRREMEMWSSSHCTLWGLWERQTTENLQKNKNNPEWLTRSMQYRFSINLWIDDIPVGSLDPIGWEVMYTAEKVFYRIRCFTGNRQPSRDDDDPSQTL